MDQRRGLAVAWPPTMNAVPLDQKEKKYRKSPVRTRVTEGRRWREVVGSPEDAAEAAVSVTPAVPDGIVCRPALFVDSPPVST